MELRSFKQWQEPSPAVMEKVQRLRRMLDSGLITQEDYDQHVRKLIAS
jgi:hypothetical protein